MSVTAKDSLPPPLFPWRARSKTWWSQWKRGHNSNQHLFVLPSCLSVPTAPWYATVLVSSQPWLDTDAALRQEGHIHTPPGAGKSNFRFVSLG